MKIAAVQMVSTPDVARNLDTARRLVAQAAAEGARLVALPEYFCLFGHADGDKLAIAESPGDGPIQRMLAQTAQAHRIWLLGGTLPMRVPQDPAHVFNACCVFNPEGALAARYDKIHLFRYDNSDEHYDEATAVQAGRSVVSFDAAIPDELALRVGLSVCYDLRFPELYRALGSPSPCDLISVPSAFTYTTGQAHWELLLRTRAVENQSYVLAPAQGGRHENGRRTWGHTMIVDPWGEILNCLPEGEGVVTAQLLEERIGAVRRQLPALQHRRL